MRAPVALLVTSLLVSGCAGATAVAPAAHPAPRVSDCFDVTEARAQYEAKLDELLVGAGYLSSVGSRHAAIRDFFGTNGEVTSVLLHSLRPGLDRSEAHRRNLRHYGYGQDRGRNVTYNDDDLFPLVVDKNTHKATPPPRSELAGCFLLR